MTRSHMGTLRVHHPQSAETRRGDESADLIKPVAPRHASSTKSTYPLKIRNLKPTSVYICWLHLHLKSFERRYASSFKDQTLTIVQNVLHSLISFVDCQHFTWGYVNIHNHQQVKGVSHVCLYRCQWSVVKGIRCCFEKILKHHPFQRRELLWTAELSRRLRGRSMTDRPRVQVVEVRSLATTSHSKVVQVRLIRGLTYVQGTHEVLTQWVITFRGPLGPVWSPGTLLWWEQVCQNCGESEGPKIL